MLNVALTSKEETELDGSRLHCDCEEPLSLRLLLLQMAMMKLESRNEVDGYSTRRIAGAAHLLLPHCLLRRCSARLTLPSLAVTNAAAAVALNLAQAQK